MSRPGHQTIDMENQPLDNYEPPPPDGPKFYDTSGPFFSLYSDVAGEEDNKMTERWQHDATEGILVFTGLFSAAVTVLLAVTVQDLRPNPQDTSAFYLANIYQIFADPNFTLPRTSIPSPVAAPAPFSPPTYSIWVNSLWFLSLVISLSCALLAMLLRQWARRFIRLTRREGHTPEERARTRAFFSRGIQTMHVPFAVEALPALLHLALFLFFAGLLIFLFNINHSTFISVAWCIGVFLVLYGWITILPIFQPNSPYYGPLSPAAWLLYTALLRPVLLLLRASLRFALFPLYIALRPAFFRFQANLLLALFQLYTALRTTFKSFRVVSFIIACRSLVWCYSYRMSTHLWRVADEVVAKDKSYGTDVNILRWTMKNTLGEDNKLEKFFHAIPGLLRSKKSEISSIYLGKWREFWDALDGFLHRTLWSDSVDDSIKTFRLDAYLILINERSKIHKNTNFIILALRALLRGNFGHLPQTIKRTNILARWCTDKDEEIALAARCVVARLLRSSQKHNRLWVACARDQLDIPHHILGEITNRDEHTISLAILIQMTNRIWRIQPWNHGVLSALSDFDVQKASSKLQNEFCALWNQIVEAAKKEEYDDDAVGVLRAIRHHYIALHQGTDAAPTAFDALTPDFANILCEPSSYPLCDIQHHHHQNPTATPSNQLNDADIVSPHSSRTESLLIAGGSTSPHQTEVDITSRRSSSVAHPPPHSQGLPSTSTTTVPMHVPLQIASVTDRSIHGSIQTVALDLIRLISMEASHQLSRSSSDRIANVVRRDPHPDHPPVTVMPSTILHVSSVSEQQQPESNMRQDVTVPHPASDITQISFMANQISQINSNAGVAPQASEESTRVPPTIEPALRSGVILIVLPSPEESAPVRPDRVSHAFRPTPPSFTTSRLPSPPPDHEHD